MLFLYHWVTIKLCSFNRLLLYCTKFPLQIDTHTHTHTHTPHLYTYEGSPFNYVNDGLPHHAEELGRVREEGDLWGREQHTHHKQWGPRQQQHIVVLHVSLGHLWSTVVFLHTHYVCVTKPKQLSCISE